MKLHETIKKIVDQFGKDVITERRFLNMVADYYSFKDNPAGKTVLTALVNGGYLHRLLGTLSEKELLLAINQIKKDVENNYGFRQDIIEDILSSIVQGLNIKITESSSIKFTHQTRSVNKEAQAKGSLQSIDETISPRKEKTTGDDILPMKNHVFSKTNSITSQKSTTVGTNKKKRNLPYVKIAAFWAVIVFGVFFGYNYFISPEERENFNHNLLSGDTFLKNGDYANAVESYKAAYNAYNSFNKGSYKSDALEKIDALTDRLIKEGDNKSLNEAYNTIVSELQLDLNNSDKERLESKKMELEATIKKNINNGQNTLITIISANNGKLDEKGKQLLENLLQLAPDDYWLNFIKKKSYD